MEEKRERGHGILPRGTWPIYPAWLLPHTTPSLASVEFCVTLHTRQSETQVTDSQAAGSGLLEGSKEWVGWGGQPAVEWLPLLAYCVPLARLMPRNCLHLSSLCMCQL